MREIRSYGSVGEREGNDPLYPEIAFTDKPRFSAHLISFGYGKAFNH